MDAALVLGSAMCCVSVACVLVIALSDSAAAGEHTGDLIAVLEDRLNGAILPGTGAGKGKSFAKGYRGSPFPLQACVLAFDVLFEPDFEWACRGKVGGLFVGTGSASGGNYSRDGASLRFMWEGASTPVVPFAYAYVPEGSQDQQPPPLSKQPEFGAALFQKEFGRILRPGQWYHIELGIKLNTLGKSDGVLYMAVDGKSYKQTGVVWRLVDVGITKAEINSFVGGGCQSTRKSGMQLRNMAVHTWKD